MARGRPTLYSEELADRICQLVATNTCGIDKIIAMYDGLPDQSTIRLWRLTYPSFSTKYLQAKQLQAELYAEETFDIAHQKHVYYDEKGNERVDAGHVAWQKLNVNTRQWHASKLAPKIYGDQKQIEQLQDSNSKLQQELNELRAQLAEKYKKEY